MDQLRIYTLTDKETAEHYFTVHWANHKINLPNFGFEVKGVWIGNTPAIANQVIAIVSFPDNEDAEQMTERYFKSAEYIKLMGGFDRSNFINSLLHKERSRSATGSDYRNYTDKNGRYNYGSEVKSTHLVDLDR